MRQLSDDRSVIHKVILGLVLTVILINAIRVGMKKEDFYFDEKCTFTLSNMSSISVPEFLDILKRYDYSVDAIIQEFIDMSVIEGTRFTDQQVNELMTVQENERFSIFGTLLADTMDSHPPLYYVLFHVLCSMFMDMPLLYVGLIINIVSLMVTCFMIYKICKKHTDGFYAILAAMFYGLGLEFINNVTYIRNYAMFTMWVALLVYLHYDLIGSDGEICRKNLTAICVVEILAMLTQFFAALFLIPMFVITLLRLRLHRTPAKKYVVSQIVTGVIYLVIWPPSIFQVLFDESAFEVRGSIFSAQTFGKIKSYASLLRASVFAGSNMVLLVSFVVIIAAFVLFVRENFKGKKFAEALEQEGVEKFVMLFASTAVFYALSVISSPWVADRYVAACIPEISIIVFLAFWYLLNRIIKNHYVGWAIMLVLVALASVRGNTMPPYNMCFVSPDKQAFIDSYSDREAIIVEPEYHAEFLDPFMSMHHPYWTLVREDRLSEFLDSHADDYKSFVVYANETCNMDELVDVFEEHGEIMTKYKYRCPLYEIYVMD